MICVMTSKWVGDAISKDGIYPVWIALRQYPWLSPFTYHDKGETGADVMKSFDELVVINDELSPGALDALLKKYDFNGFPVVRGTHLVGFATREKIKAVLGELGNNLLRVVPNWNADTLSSDDLSDDGRKCFFSSRESVLPEVDRIDFSVSLEEAVLQLRKNVPQELVVNMFQKLNLRQILFSQSGNLTGMATKADVVSLLTSHFSHTGALAQRPRDPP
ncbi:hypothetical protein C0995_008501 [Termitomyces sp. Mi166|nr:hypothetical protein C0995_008501 [Termitomyces sp. Mi166\